MIPSTEIYGPGISLVIPGIYSRIPLDIFQKILLVFRHDFLQEFRNFLQQFPQDSKNIESFRRSIPTIWFLFPTLCSLLDLLQRSYKERNIFDRRKTDMPQNTQKSTNSRRQRGSRFLMKDSSNSSRSLQNINIFPKFTQGVPPSFVFISWIYTDKNYDIYTSCKLNCSHVNLVL